MRLKLPTLSTELYERLFEALLNCEEFENNVRLQEFIANGELSVYHKWFLKHENETKKEELIDSTIKYLARQRLYGIKPALPLLLAILCNPLTEGDALRDELEDLYNQVEFELLSFYKTPSPSKPVTTTTSPTPHIYHSSLPNLSQIEVTEVISLDPSDREWIIRFVDNVIEHIEHPGRKNLLLNAGIPSVPAINRIQFGGDSRSVAEAIVNLIEARDKPNENLHYLEAFLHHLIETDAREGEEVETKVEALLAKYRNQTFKRRMLSPSLKYPDQQYENQIINQRLQEVRGAIAAHQPTSTYKIDASAIIQCNLDKQRTHFINGFHGHYKGFFTFAVASIDHDVLKNYVIESLIWELKRRTKRPTDVRHVHLYSEHFSSLSIEQGSLDLQTKLKSYFGIQSFNDLIEDNPDTDLVIVLWNRNISLNNFKHIALRFSQNLKEHVHDILQKRCLILLWASYGPIPIEPLEVSITLPAFEQFEVEHVVEWLETQLSSLQKSEQIPEAIIKYCRERLIAKIMYHGGSLPGTYESLLEPLELGGLF